MIVLQPFLERSGLLKMLALLITVATFILVLLIDRS
jgi:hypothetical protein